jgi:hypothetical protein
MDTEPYFIGIIYLLTSPSGHSYVGQTIQDRFLRWRQHELDAEHHRDHCKALCNAIRKHGFQNFKKEILWVYRRRTKKEILEILDQAEVEYISMLMTLHPDGYNMHTGGRFSGAGTVYTDEIRDNYSRAKRVNTLEDYDLPRNVLYIHTEQHEGFRLNIQDKPRYQFTDKSLSLDEKYALVMQKYREVLDGTDQGRKTHPYTNIRKYVSYHEGRDCFIVNKPGFQRRQFRSMKFTSDEKLQMAYDYLDSLQ